MPILAFIIGACFGSFANVIMTRLNALSLLSRSKCLSCGTPIRNIDNIPILSYFYLRGKCRHCGSRFSSRYMWVETMMAMIGLLVWYRVYVPSAPMYMNWIHYGLDITLFTILMGISLYDYKHKIVPTQLSTALIINGVLQICVRLYDHTDQFGLLNNTIQYNAFIEAIAGVITALPYTVLFFVSRGRWVGFGDVLVFAGAGWALGLVNGIYVFLYSIWIAGLFTIVWYGLEKKRDYLKIEVPFAPFIALASLLVYMYNMDILGIHNVIMYGF